MKKSLIALAVLAASGASFAQVSITGNYTFGYKASSTAAAAAGAQSTTQALVGGSAGNAAGDASGLGIDTSLVTFSAKEDLGGGMSVAAEMNIDGLNRGGIAGGDSSLKLTTGVGRITLQTYKPADYLSGGISGVGGVGLDNKVFPQRGLKDSIGFDTKLGPVYVGISHAEQASASGGSTAGVGIGLGAGASGSATTVGQRLTSLSVTYIGGPLIANVNYLQYDNRTANSDTSYKDVIRTAGSYDFGGFKLGAGFSQLTVTSGATITDGLIAASVPLGNVTLGANFGTETASGTTLLGAGVLDQTRTGYSLAATYALSKRTSLIANYANWQAFSGASQRNSETNLLLSHSF
jgi:predicted porin